MYFFIIICLLRVCKPHQKAWVKPRLLNLRDITDSTAKIWNLLWRISSVNVTKSAGNCEFGDIHGRNPLLKILFFAQSSLQLVSVIEVFFYKHFPFEILKQKRPSKKALASLLLHVSTDKTRKKALSKISKK